MQTELFREIHIKDLRIGDILINLGVVVWVDEYQNVFRVKCNHEFTDVFTFSKSKSLIVKRNLNE